MIPIKRFIPFRISLIYAIVGILWILISDILLESFAEDIGMLTHLQTLKGWLFILATAPILYFLVRHYFLAIQRSEEALRKSEQRFHTIVEIAQEGIVIVDERGRVEYLNQQMAEMLGYEIKDIQGRNLLHFIDEADHQKVLACIERCKQGEREKNDVRFRTRTGGVRWTVVSANPLFNEYGRFIGSLGMVADITTRKSAEEALREANEILRAVIHSAPIAILTLDPEGKIRMWNSAAERIFGWTEKEVLNKPNPIVPEYDREEFRTVRKRVLNGEILTGLELQRKKKDGTLIDVSISTAPLYAPGGTVMGTIVLLSDITAQKGAAQALRESEERYRVVAETALDAIITIDEESTIVFVNPAAERMFGYRADEMVGHSLTMLMPEHLRNAHLSALKNYIATGKRHIQWHAVETSGRHREGSSIPLEISYGEVIKDGRHFFTGIARDISERKHAERAMRKSEEKYRSLFEESKDVIYISTPEGRFLDINPAGVDLFGYPSKEELLGIDIPKDLYMNPDDREKVKRVIAEHGFIKDCEVKVRKKSGEILTVLLTGVAVRNEQGEIVAYRGFMHDITEQKKLEQQLIQSQKMEAIGKLAGGVAHDFNNILTAIISYGNLLQMTLGKDHPAHSYGEQILALAERATHLTQSLLAFSRKQIMNPVQISVNEIIRRAEKLISKLIGENIELRITFAEKELMVMADVVQIEQVLMNLATNARDAMPNGGTLRIKAEEIALDSTFVRTHGYGQPGMYALISVVDTGVGMDAKTRERIFEPFFTTKEMGKGTGLGLSIVYGIIKQHNGYISVYSEPGRGTAVKIFLPLVRTEDRGAAQEQGELPSGRETVLMAEDEPEVRRTTKEVLEKFGYHIIEAVDGEDAVSKFMEHKDAVQLLLFDVAMPNKNGREAYEEIKKVRPDIRVLFTSGYTTEMIQRRRAGEEEVHFLSKPYEPAQLLKKIREVLK